MLAAGVSTAAALVGTARAVRRAVRLPPAEAMRPPAPTPYAIGEWAGYDDTTIRKMGRWSSSTFLIYIRNQVANLATGVSVAMASALQYHNVG